MAFENSITEKDLDPGTKKYLDGLSASNDDGEPDLAVDGLSDSLLSRLLGLFGIGRSHR